LGRRTVGGSPWRARGDDGGRAKGCTGEGVGRLLLARLVRLVSTSELGRRYWWGREDGGAPEAAVDGGQGRWRWRARAEWRELDGSYEKRSERLLLRTDSERVSARAAAACAARGAEVAAGWQGRSTAAPCGGRRPCSCHVRDSSTRAPAMGVAHGVAAACSACGGREQVAAVGAVAGSRRRRTVRTARVQASDRVGRFNQVGW
jgi:hypothetical protein